MQFTSSTAGETINDLVTRVYDLGPSPSSSALRRARTAITGANPFLKTGVSVPEGTVVAVPDLVEGATTGTLAPDQMAVAVGSSQLSGAIGLLADLLQAELAVATEAANSTLQELKGAEIKRAARGDEQLAATLPRLAAAARARADAGRRLEQYTKVAISGFQDDLTALRRAFG